MSAHEPLMAGRKVKMGSDRSFGFVIGLFFTLIGLSPLFRGNAARLWALITAGIILFVAFAAPSRLGLLNRIWFRFGMLLNRVMEPVIMGIIFWVVITPFGIALRLLKPDMLSLRFDEGAKTYWVPRGDGGTDLKNQF